MRARVSGLTGQHQAIYPVFTFRVLAASRDEMPYDSDHSAAMTEITIARDIGQDRLCLSSIIGEALMCLCQEGRH